MSALAADLPLLRRWTAARVRLALRTPRALFMTFALPLVLIVVFDGLNGNARVDAATGGGRVAFAQYYTPSIGIFALTAACYSTLVLGIATARDSGLLKRVRGTPLPMWVYLVAWMVGGGLVGMVAVALLFVVAVPAFGVHVYLSQLPAAIVSLALGAACLTALGIAVASVVRTAEQAMPIAQLTFLPVAFISGIFFPLQGAPDWLVKLADIFPLHHLVVAFDGAFQPHSPHAGWSGGDLWSLVAWTAIAGFVAARRFSREV